MRTILKSFLSVLATTGFAAVLSTPAFAQQAQPPQLPQGKQIQAPATQPSRVTARKPDAAMAQNDRTIATMLAICSQSEIDHAKLTLTKAEDKKVRELAEMIVKDHTAMLTKLQQFGGQAGAADRPATDRPVIGNRELPNNTNAASDTPRKETPRTEIPRTGGSDAQARVPAGQLDFMMIHRQIAQECLKSAREQWESKPVAESEMCFVGTQIVKHQEMLDTNKVLQQHVSTEFQQAIRDGSPTIQQHLDHAKKLVEELSKSERNAANN